MSLPANEQNTGERETDGGGFMGRQRRREKAERQTPMVGARGQDQLGRGSQPDFKQAHERPPPLSRLLGLPLPLRNVKVPILHAHTDNL